MVLFKVLFSPIHTLFPSVFYFTKNSWKVYFEMACNIFDEFGFMSKSDLSALISLSRIRKSDRESNLG